MTSNELKRILSGIGIDVSSDETGFIQLNKLKLLNLTSDGNHIINYFTDFINFDFKNELIKIKERDPEGISGVFDIRGAVVDGKSIILNRPPLEHDIFKFRRHALGDAVYYVDRKTYKRDSSLDDIIVNINRGTVTVKKNIPDLNHYYMCYAAGSSFKNAVLDITDNRLAYKYTDRTKFKYDHYIAFSAIAGLTFRSSKSTQL